MNITSSLSNSNAQHVFNSAASRAVFFPLVDENTINLLPDDFRASYAAFCSARLKELQVQELVVPAGLPAFYAEVVRECGLPVTAVCFVDTPISDEVLKALQDTPCNFKESACRLLYLERDTSLTEHAQLLDGAAHLVTFCDDHDTAFIEAASSKGCTVTNLYLFASSDSARVSPKAGA